MNKVIHKAESRGHANHGWLNSNHSFSFAQYYNPERMGFGALRVLNDDTVAPGMGFGTHPHENMEIISIPLEGDLEHKDSIGTNGIIKQGDVQVMSAGTGILHSEFNANKDKDVKFLQIWVIPNTLHVEPRYDQITLDKEKMKNNFHQILSPTADDEGVWIHQNAWFHIGEFTQNTLVNHKLNLKDTGLYAFLIEGDAEIAGEDLTKRDGIGIWDTQEVEIKAKEGSKILLMEVPFHKS